MPRLRHPLIVLTLLACGATLLALAYTPRWTTQQLAAEWRQKIDAADEDTAAALVEQLGKLDAAALAHLVELLDDPRQQVRSAAREAIQQKLALWSNQRTADSERNLSLLASTMAAHDLPANLHSRVFIKLTALKLLRCSLHSGTTDRVKFLADCSSILDRAADAYVDAAEVVPKPAAQYEPSLDVAAEIAPYEPPYELLEETPSAPVESDAEPELLPPGEVLPLPPGRIKLESPRRIRSSEISSQTHQIDDDALRALATRSLFRHLLGVPAIAAAAERELRSRGFNDAALGLARALESPDPAVRRQLAESLPGLAGIDPAPWLWELANDEEENVRRIARAILATSSNPQTRMRVGRLK